MRILITGASGFIGRSAVASYSRAGWKVRAVSRKTIQFSSDVESLIITDVLTANWNEILQDVDCVLHLAGIAHRPFARWQEYENINVHFTSLLVKAAILKKIKHFIFVSSIAVYGRKPTTIDANTPLGAQNNNGKSKVQAEQNLITMASKTDLKWTIIRPPLVYGPGALGNFSYLKNLIKFGMPLPIASSENLRSYIGIQNLTSVLTCITGNPNAANKTFLISDDDDLSTTELIKIMAIGLGKNARLFKIPVRVLRMIAFLTGRAQTFEKLFGNLQIDITTIKNDLNWKPPLTAAESILLAIKNERSQN